MKATLSAPFPRGGLFKQTILQQEASYSKDSLWSNWKLTQIKTVFTDPVWEFLILLLNKISFKISQSTSLWFD